MKGRKHEDFNSVAVQHIDLSAVRSVALAPSSVKLKMSSSDSSDHEDEFDEIRCYFPPREWEGMSNYEKGSYANAARNYQAMLRAGE